MRGGDSVASLYHVSDALECLKEVEKRLDDARRRLEEALSWAEEAVLAYRDVKTIRLYKRLSKLIDGINFYERDLLRVMDEFEDMLD